MQETNNDKLFAENYEQSAWDLFLKECFDLKEFKKANEFLTKAVNTYGETPEINWSLAVVKLQLRKFDEYEVELKRCISLDQKHEGAYLLLAELYSKQNKHKKAIKTFHKLYFFQPSFLSQAYLDSAPPLLKNAIDVARRYLYADYRQGMGKILASLEKKGETRRLQVCFEYYLGLKSRPKYDKFNPSSLFFPGIRKEKFYDAAEFPQLQALSDSRDEILSEYLALDSKFEDYINLHSNKGGEFLLPQFKDFDDQHWDAFHLYRYGRLEDNCKKCPVTADVLNKVKLPNVSGFMPEAFFSRLGAGSKIPAHYGLSNIRLAVHWPIVVNDDCFIDVGGEKRAWELGKPLIFDDSYLHAAENNSKDDRIVLIFDTWHPDLTTLERDGLKQLFDIKTLTNLD